MFSKKGLQERFFDNPECLRPAFFGDYNLHEQLEIQARTEKNIEDIKYKIIMGRHSFDKFMEDFANKDGKVRSIIRPFEAVGPYHIYENGAQFYEINLKSGNK